MSTRGAITRPTPNGRVGRYHHFDSYPTGLGAELVRLYHATFDRDLDDMATVLIDAHPAGWSTLISSSSEGPFPRTHFDQSGFTEIDSPARGHFPECYCHGTRAEPDDLQVCGCPDDDTGCDPIFIEWVYVLTPSGLAVLTSRSPSPRLARVTHRPVALVPWDDTNPNWDAIEYRALYPQPQS